MDLATLYCNCDSLEDSISDLSSHIELLECKIEMLWKIVPKEYIIRNTWDEKPIKIFVNKVMAETWLEEQMTADKSKFRKKSELAKEKVYNIKLEEVPRGLFTNGSI